MTTAPGFKSPAHKQGYLVGLRHESETRYGYSNPYDRRRKEGKEWEAGKVEGRSYRCYNGVEEAKAELARLS